MSESKLTKEGARGADCRHRYTAERLQKTENVVEKYKKKLEESAGLRREFKVRLHSLQCPQARVDSQKLEEENLALVESNSSLEAELKKTGGSKSGVENHKAQVAALEKQALEQANEVCHILYRH
jgi:protein HOOK3